MKESFILSGGIVAVKMLVLMTSLVAGLIVLKLLRRASAPVTVGRSNS